MYIKNRIFPIAKKEMTRRTPLFSYILRTLVVKYACLCSDTCLFSFFPFLKTGERAMQLRRIVPEGKGG